VSILAILKGIFTLAGALARLAERKQLMDAGEANAVARDARRALWRIEKARRARRAVRDDPDSVRSDPRNRD